MDKETAGLGLLDLTLLWGLITQALAFGGVIDWPWYTIWGPFLVLVAIVVAIFIFIVLVTAFDELLDRR